MPGYDKGELTGINKNIYFAAVSGTFQLCSSYIAQYSGEILQVQTM